MIGTTERSLLSPCACCDTGLGTSPASRRDFLAGGSAAVGLAASGLASCRAVAQPGSASAKPHRIDVHHHLIPPRYLEAVASTRIGSQARPWSPEMSLVEMDRNAVATAMVSIIQPGAWLKEDVGKSRAIAREINELGARMMEDHPGRFGLWAAIPLPDTEGSLREIEYAFDTLKADGIGLMTSFNEKYLGHASFAPVYAELNRRKAVVYIHPQTPDCCRNIASEMPASSVEYATDTTRSIGSLVFSGTAARYPDIRWIFSHSGGTAPFLISRFVRVDEDIKDRSLIPNGALYEMRKFYYDTAQGNHKGALDALRALAPTSQILFGTDYPMRPAQEEVDALTAYGFAPADLQAIERGNALPLIPRLMA
jgi:predicted TIM-barrel fold metal-dependent hydrolase